MLGTPDPIEVSFGLSGSLDIVRSTLLVIQDTKSTAPHGLYFEVEVLSDIESLTLSAPNDSSWSFDIVFPGGFLVGDIISCSSEHDNKVIYMTRGEDVIFLADTILPGSIWPIIFPGDNQFIFSPAFVRWVQVWHYPTYWGV